jgi:uroporphyrinogen-III synthase
MAHEDWRIHVQLTQEGAQSDFLDRLTGALDDEAEELAKALSGDRLAVSRDDKELFVYASSKSQAEHARAVIRDELSRHGFEATVSSVEHWLVSEERWDDEPKGETWEEEEVEQGEAPWEVRVTCSSRGKAKELAERLESEGYRLLRRWRYLIVGTETREDAKKLAGELHGEVEPGGDVAWDEAADAGIISPFRLF